MVQGDLLILDFAGTSDQRLSASIARSPRRCPWCISRSRRLLPHLAVQNGLQILGRWRSVARGHGARAVRARSPCAILTQQALADVVLKRRRCWCPRTAGGRLPRRLLSHLRGRGLSTIVRGCGSAEPGYFLISDIIGGGWVIPGDGIPAVDTHGGNCASSPRPRCWHQRPFACRAPPSCRAAAGRGSSVAASPWSATTRSCPRSARSRAICVSGGAGDGTLGLVLAGGGPGGLAGCHVSGGGGRARPANQAYRAPPQPRRSAPLSQRRRRGLGRSGPLLGGGAGRRIARPATGGLALAPAGTAATGRTGAP